jgi:CRISPR-associated protein (TIGR02584 family)
MNKVVPSDWVRVAEDNAVPETPTELRREGDSMQPKEYPHRWLLGVTGLNPQVVTETLYALAVQEAEGFVPTRIRLLTTEKGAQRARLGLLDEHKGQFHHLCRDYGLEGRIQFDEDDIVVLPDGHGNNLSDIRTEADNRAAADAITEHVRELTADPDSALHVSLAGGRKTMGFYLAFALSLFGRAQDRLSHVLVSEPFEADPQFYYPPPQPEVLFIHNEPVRTDQARITLADIPFVRLRTGLPQSLEEGQLRYSEVVESVQGALGPTQLVIDLDNQRVQCGRTVLDGIQPQHLALLAWFARRRQRRQGAVGWAEADPEEFLAEYRAIVGEMAGAYERAREILLEEDHDSKTRFFQEKRSRVNRILQENLGPLHGRYAIQSIGKRLETRYTLELDPDQIRFEAIPKQESG